ncbi:MAG: SDR family oxidoreductase [Deltaproteobacteria bacterium]|nr:SDR family oxidoreductase [Deltaproteobacteria bacterium]
MKVLVTGATGFVGSHVVQKLLKLGHPVRVLRRANSSLKMLEGLNVEHVIGDVTDRASVFKAVEGCDVVFHVAGYVTFWEQNKALQDKINIDGTRNVVEACLAHKVKRLIHTSSIAAIGYAPEGRLGDETIEYNWWPYRINYNNSKYLAAEEVRQGIKQGLDAVMVNPAVIFGPGDLNLNGGAMVFQIARRKVPIYLASGGCCVCDVEDVADGHILAWQKGKTGEKYILGGDNFNWKDLFTLIAEVVGVPPPRWKMPPWANLAFGYGLDFASKFTKKEPPLTSDLARISAVPVYYSSEKAIQELGYKISPFRETIRKTYEWYRENEYIK